MKPRPSSLFYDLCLDTAREETEIDNDEAENDEQCETSDDEA